MMAVLLKIIILCAALGYLLSAVLYWRRKNKAAFILHGAAWILNGTVILVNWVINGYMPFVSMYQVLTFLSFCFTLSALYMHFIRKQGWLFPYFSLCSGIIMTGVFWMDASLVWHFAPALQSVWFLPHVFSYMLSYTLCAVSFVLTLVRLIRRKEQEKMERGVYDTVCLAYPFMTAGMLFGALWANEVWGHFWSWDPKENWSLVTWLLYALYLHCRRLPKYRGLATACIIIGFAALLMTFLGVNFFGAGALHSYTS
ncbi:MAG TPA: cytochrome c biogenesis protein CcsA [Firmicutes bacterium]|nr:cytochrome c biogenesis protein CcsA [Bacillota bacterium]